MTLLYVGSVLYDSTILCRYDSELHSSVELEGENAGGKRERILLQQVKLLKEEREHLQVSRW